MSFNSTFGSTKKNFRHILEQCKKRQLIGLEMRKELEKKHSKNCLLGSCHFEEVELLPSGKRKLLTPLFLTLLCFASPVSAGTFNVTDTSDDPNAINGGAGTLRNAILMANQESGPSIILLPNNTAITLQATLPLISSPITFIGMGPQPSVIDGQGKYQAFPLDCLHPPSQIVNQNLSIINSSKTGSNGGGIGLANGGGGGGGSPGLGGFMYIPPGTTYNASGMTFSGNSGNGGAGPGGNGGVVNGTPNAGGAGGGGGTPTTSGINGGSTGTDTIGGGGGASTTANGANSNLNNGGDGGSNPGSGAIPPGTFNGGNGTGTQGGGGGGADLVFITSIQGAGGSAVSGAGGGGASSVVAGTAGPEPQPNGGSSVPNSSTFPYFGGGGGGGGGSPSTANVGITGSGGNGGTYGGGGGGGDGGSGIHTNNGGTGGFGAGGGGQGAFTSTSGISPTEASGGYGGGSGGSGWNSGGTSLGAGGGGGGAGFGGAIYIDNAYNGAATAVNLTDALFTGNTATGGSAGGQNNGTAATNGAGWGQDVFMTSGSTLNYTFSTLPATNLNLAGDGNQRSGGTNPWTTGGLIVSGPGTLTLTNTDSPNGANYTGATFINPLATLSISRDAQLGNATNGSGKVFLQGSTLLVTASTSGTRSFGLATGSGSNIISTNSGVTYGIGGTVSGGGPLEIAGSGEVNLTGTSNTIGTVTIDPNATLGLQANGSITAGQTINLSGTLKSIGSALNLNNPISVSGISPTVNASSASITLTGPITGSPSQLLLEGTTIAIAPASGPNTYSAPTLSTVTTLQSSGTNPFGTGTLTLGGTTTWDLTAANTLSNPINFQNNVALVAQAGASTFSGSLSGAATVSYSATAGSLSLTPTTNSNGFTGTLINTSQPLTIAGTSPLGGTSATYILTGTSPSTRVTGNTTAPNTIAIDTNSTPTFTAAAGTKGIFSGVIQNRAGNTGTVTFQGSGASSLTQLTGANTFTVGAGNTVDLAGLTMKVSGTSPFGAAANTVTLNNANLEFIANSTISNHLILGTTPNAIIADTGTINSLAGGITGTGSSYSVGLTTGSENGIITLNGPTTGAPSITFNQGTLQTPSETNLGAGALTFSGYGGNLELTGSSAYTNTIAVNPSTTSSPFGGSIILDPSTTNTWSGIISGSSPLGIQGTGILALTGANGAFSGGFYINQATVQAASEANIGTGTINLSNSGTLELTTAGQTYTNNLALGVGGGNLQLDTGLTTWIGTLSGTTPLSLLGTGTLDLSGSHNATFSGGININAAGLEVTTPADLGTGAVGINGGSLSLLGTGEHFSNSINLGVNGGTIAGVGAINTLAGTISGPGALTLPGPGTLVITGINNYLGGTNINGGTVEICGSSPFGMGTITFGGGDLEITCSTILPNNVNFASSGSITTDPGTSSTIAGSLSGAGSFTKLGSGTLAINGSSPTFSGPSFIDAGLIQLCGINPLGTGPITFDGGNVEFTCSSFLSNPSITLAMTTMFIADPQTVTTITSPISGVASGFTKSGAGTIVLTGVNPYSGPTLVTAGTLEIDGTLPNSATTVSSGATLSGIGTVGTVDVFGTLAAGNPTGTLTTTKTTFETGSTFKVLLNGSPYSSLDSTTNVSILPGSTLLPILNPYLPMTYTIIDAVGFVTGRFLPISAGSARFPVTVRYDRHTVKLTVGEVPFANIIAVGNVHNIGVCFDSLITHITPELQADLNILNGLSTFEIGAAFEQFDPGIYNAIFYAEESVGERVRNIYTQHGFDRQFDNCFQGGIWTAFYGEEIQQHKLKDGQAFSGYKDNFNGVVTGFDVLLPNNGLASAGFAYAKSKMHWTDVSGANANIESYTGFIGGTWYMFPFMVDAFASYTRNVAHGERAIFIGPSTDVPIPLNTPFPLATFTTPIAKSISYTNNSTLYTTHIGMMSKREIFSRNFFAISYGNLDYLFVKREPFNETGGGATNLSVHGNSSDLLRPELGFGVGFFQPVIHCGVITGDVRVGFVKELRFIGHSTVANFTGNGCNFTVGGLFPRQNLVSTAVNLLLTGAFGFDLAFDFEGLYGSHYASSAGKVELTYLF